jgi:hypothetical protein
MEDIINQIDGKVQVIFERTYNDQIFRDALWFSDAEYSTIVPEQILVMQNQRFNNWLTIVNPVITEPQPTVSS